MLVQVLIVLKPFTGMFALLDVSALDMSGKEYVWHLLDRSGVAVMPGESFGSKLNDWVRVSLTQPGE